MSKKSFIDSVEVKSPCSEDWEKMHGNDRVRFCDHCAKDVKNISAVTRKEATRLVRASDGKICIRYTVDPATKRPVFADQLFQIKRRAPGLAAGVMTASIAFSTAAYAQDNSKPQSAPVVVTNTNPAAISTTDEPKTTGETTTRQLQDLPVGSRNVTMGLIVMTPAKAIKNPLMRAVQNEDIDEVKNLIINGANVNGKEDDKTTPIFAAVETGNIEILRILLDAGAKINVRDQEKRTPLMFLDDDATPEVIKLLLQYDVKVNLSDREGSTALILVAGSVKPEVLSALIDAGADINHADNDGQTALMNAANSDLVESVDMLLKAGAKVNAKNKEGDTAWDLASDEKVEELLTSFGAERKKKPKKDGSEDKPIDQ